MRKMSTGEAVKLIGLYRYLLKNGKMSQEVYDKLVGNVIGYWGGHDVKINS